MDERPNKITVAINDEIDYKVDFETDEEGKKSLTTHFVERRLTYEELAEEIRLQHNIAPICRDKRGRFYRAKENLKRIDIVSLDFDNTNPAKYISFDDALNHPFIQRFGLICYTTPSHSEKLHKYRAIFHLPSPIDNWQEAERIIAALHYHFRRWEPDPACKDAARFYYGAGKNGQVVVIGNRLTDEAVEILLEDFAEASTPKPSPKVDVDFSSLLFSADGKERRRQWAEIALHTATGMIDNSIAPLPPASGTRHDARRRASKLLGGYIAGGLLDHSTAYAALSSAVARNTNNYSKSMKTIESGLVVGMALPITFEMKEREREEYLTSKRANQRKSEKQRADNTEFWRNYKPKAETHARVETEALECLNFILAGAGCPPARWPYIHAHMGVIRERTAIGHEHEWYQANRIDLGKRLKERNGETCSKRTLQATAQRAEEEFFAWQDRSGYVLLRAEIGGLRDDGEGRKRKVESTFQAPIYTAWREALEIARLNPIYVRGKRARTKALRKAAEGVLPQLLVLCNRSF